MSKIKLKKVCILGSGNWASALAKFVARRVKVLKGFDEIVTMYVHEEVIKQQYLSEAINDIHENLKYLPGFKLPKTIVANPDLCEIVKEADIIILALPFQVIKMTMSMILSINKPTAIVVSMVKAFYPSRTKKIKLITEVVSRQLKIPCSSLIIASYANEFADGKFCEATLGSRDKKSIYLLNQIFNSNSVKLSIVEDVEIVEICGALKNVISFAAGIMDGLNLEQSSKAAIIRFGIVELTIFVDIFFPRGKITTFLHSGGISDLVISAYTSRNRKLGEMFVVTGKSIREVEIEIFNGLQLPAPFIAKEIYKAVKHKGLADKFPLLTSVHLVCIGKVKPDLFIESIKKRHESVYIPKQLQL